MKIMLLASVTVAALVAAPALTKPAARPVAVIGAEIRPPEMMPKLGDFGVDLSAMDKSVAPGDDFYKFVNGGWDARTEIPADRANWGSFAMLRDLSDQRTHALIEETSRSRYMAGSSGEKIGTTYAAFMDEATIEREGAAPLKPYLDRVAAITTPTQLAAAFGEATRHGIDMPIGVGVQQDLKDNTVYATYMGQGGLGMPDRDYYLSADAKMVETRARYLAHVGNMMRLAGQADPQGAAKRIFDLETRIAQAHWSREETRQVEKAYNPVAVADLGTRMPGFDYAALLSAQSLGNQTRVIVAQPTAIAAIARIVAATPMATMREYMAWHTIHDAAPLLSSAFVNENFSFYGTTLSGTPQLKDRWKRGVDLVNGALGEAVGEIYVARYFPPEAKAKADALVRNIVAAYDIRLRNLTWMAPATKARARAKLAAFTPKIGYPTKFRDYSALVVRPGDVLGNAQRVEEFDYNRQLAKIGKPVDRSEWFMTPQTVNAYANPLMNEIVFPAAILQPPFFDPNADPAVNYGGIGAVIGHEISHHFDDQGRKFDERGNFADWWTPQDVTRFKAYTDRVVAQYSAYEPVPGAHVNGARTLGENMADLAGLNVAYDAYRISLGGRRAPVIDGYTGDQRFFLGFGQIWQTKARDASIRQNITSDPHTPGMFRPYVARNVDAWYAAWNVKPGQRYYLPPAERIKVW